MKCGWSLKTYPSVFCDEDGTVETEHSTGDRYPVKVTRMLCAEHAQQLKEAKGKR